MFDVERKTRGLETYLTGLKFPVSGLSGTRRIGISKGVQRLLTIYLISEAV